MHKSVRALAAAAIATIAAGVMAVTSLHPSQALAEPARPAAISAHAAPQFGSVATVPTNAHSYVVRSGDTLSSIAQSQYGAATEWPALWWRNKKKIHNPNTLRTGEVLRLSQWHTASAYIIRVADAAAAPPKPKYVPIASSSQTVVTDSFVAPSGGDYGYLNPADAPDGTFGECVVTRESGGNSQIMNSTGHYGLFQFSDATWIAYGGSPALFGHATIQEQEDVFMNAIDAGGEDNWAPYDGC